VGCAVGCAVLTPLLPAERLAGLHPHRAAAGREGAGHPPREAARAAGEPVLVPVPTLSPVGRAEPGWKEPPALGTLRPLTGTPQLPCSGTPGRAAPRRGRAPAPVQREAALGRATLGCGGGRELPRAARRFPRPLRQPGTGTGV